MNTESLTVKHRPGHLKDIFGQTQLVNYLSSLVKRPEQAHKNYAIIGSFGNSKTTAVRAFANDLLGVEDAASTPNYIEFDSAEESIIKNFSTLQDFIFQEVPGYKVVVFDDGLFC